MHRPIIIGSRRSALAQAQAEQILARLRRLFPKQEFFSKTIVTSGDRAANRKVLSKGIFVKEIEESLLGGAIDCAVHSMKDVPVEPRPGLVIASVPQRVDARDAFVSRRYRSWRELPRGARVGTASVRRAVQLLFRRPDLHIVDIRGNVDTRLHKLEEGAYDALILAVAGLERLGRRDVITERLPLSVMVPAPGQGALGIQVRAADRRMKRLLMPLDHAGTRRAVEAERAFLIALGGGCNIPAAAYARVEKMTLHLYGMMAETDGTGLRRQRLQGVPHRPRCAGRALWRALRQRSSGSIS